MQKAFVKMALQMRPKQKNTQKHLKMALKLNSTDEETAKVLKRLAFAYYKKQKWDDAIRCSKQGLKKAAAST